MVPNTSKKGKSGEPFPSFHYTKWLDYHLNRAVFDFGGWSFVLRHLIALLLFGGGVGLWHLLIYPVAPAVFGESLAYNLTVLIWLIAVSGLLWAFLATAENKLKLLTWAGFLPPKTRKAHISASEEPLMRNTTRIASYFAIAVEVALPVWWSTVLKLFPGYEEQFLGLYIPALVAMIGFAFVGALHLDRMWFFRKTRLPAITAGLLGLLVSLVLYRWGSLLAFWWWTPLG